MPNRIKGQTHLVIFLLFLLAGGTIYANVWQVPFLFDDVQNILENPTLRLKALDGENFQRLLTYRGLHRPVSFISFGLNYFFGGYDTTGYHLVNVAIHVFTAWLLFALFRLTLYQSARLPAPGANTDLTAGWAALLWLVHPLHTETVTYVVQRMNALAALFFVLSLLCYIKARRYVKSGDQKKAGRLSAPAKAGWLGGCLVCVLLAVGSKQNAAMVVLALAAYEWLFFQKGALPRLNFSNLLLWGLAGGLLVAVAFLFLGRQPLENILADYGAQPFTLSQRLITQVLVVIYYLSLAVYPAPTRLNLDYDFPLAAGTAVAGVSLLALLALLGLLLAACYAIKKNRLLAFGIFWYLGNLVIESSVLPLALVFEHRTYIPLMFPPLLALIAFRYGFREHPRLQIVVLLGVVLLFSGWTVQRNRVWQSEKALWADALQKSPNKARPHQNLGKALSDLGENAAAARQFRAALAIDPDYEEALFSLGNYLRMTGRFSEAIAYYQRALALRPYAIKTHNNLGLTLNKAGDPGAAIKHFKEALRLKKLYDQDPQAVVDLDMAKVHNNLGLALVRAGKPRQALAHYRQALAVKPAYPKAHNNLGLAYDRLGEYQKAGRHYQAALAIDPRYSKAFNNWGISLEKSGRVRAAIKKYRAALSLDPSYEKARLNLKRAEAKAAGLNRAGEGGP